MGGECRSAKVCGGRASRGIAAAVVAALALAGCSMGHPASGVPPVTRSTASDTATGPPAPRDGGPPAPIDVTGTTALGVQAAPPPAALSPPAGIQALVFADASNGWMVTSVQEGYGNPAWAAGVWRTRDGGATWSEVWRGWDVRLDRVGLLPGGAGVFAAGVRQRGTGSGTPLLLTSIHGGHAWDTVTPSVPPRPAGTSPWPVWSALQFDFVTARVGYATIEPEDEPYGPSTLVLATSDGGDTWRALPLPSGFRVSGGLDFRTAQQGWITGGIKGTCDQIWRTDDGGQTWTPVPDTCPPYTLYAVDFTSAERGFAAGGSIPFIGARTGILETDDGGVHWHPVYDAKGALSAGPVTHLAFSSASQGWAWGGTCKMGQNGPCPGSVMVSRDGGRTWSRTGVGALALSVAGGVAWAQGGYQTGLRRSSDGGATWSAQPLRLPSTARFEMLETALNAVWLTTQGGTFRSSGGGTTWVRAGPLGVIVRAAPDLVFSTQSPTLRVSRDGGTTWTALTLPGETDGVTTVAFATPQEGWALLPGRGCFDCTTVDRTQDGGRTWTSVGQVALQGTGAHAAFSRSVGVIAGGATMVGSGPGAIVPAIGLTTDRGAHWRLVRLPAGTTCYQPAAVGRTVLVPCQAVDGSGFLLRSTDGGGTWHEFIASALVPEDIAMTDALHGWMLAGAGGPTDLSLYRTGDGGANWTQTWPELH